MKYPISIFIMDVTNSSKNWDEITAYLGEMEGLVRRWTRGLPHAQVKHRLGDEIVGLFDHYSTAYTVAFYISQIWKYKEQPPYFGITFGTVDSSLQEIDLDKWNHPLMRQARVANEKIKHSSQRLSMLLLPDDEYMENTSLGMANLLLSYQHKFMKDQTALQQLISTLYAILDEQKAIARLVNKSPSTISSHYKKGNCEIILNTLYTLQETFDKLESTSFGTQPQNITKELTQTIKNELYKNIDSIISI
ncbi:helix-turn-helix domain-containing protein [Bacillus sp. CHD6a]|uniref:helix-turn-helix domain-containing protein n=1 Tax=Bacillus sp. CHD6a TaxID=1643452 RepID=UPI0006CCC70B|nr:helix-turn-helix domain-containing protein [Bacillus sp. CHD6a]KPB06405.1 hypothetical protein AAV98_00995 [Bacillus sp. CHD6a]